MSDRVDAIIGAYFTHESISLGNEGYPVTVLRMEDWGVPDYYELVLVTSEDYLSDNEDIVKRFTRAVSKGYSDAILDPQAGIDILQKYVPELDENIDRPGADLLRQLWQDEKGKFGGQKESKWIGFSQWMKENDIINDDLDASSAYTNKYFAD